MSDRIWNFSAGPAVLPEEVLREAQRDLWNLAGSGIGVMEHSHRGRVFEAVLEEAERLCREVGGVPDTHRVLFLQGGASLQFAMVPMNLAPEGRTADYLVTGVWSQKALTEAKLLGAPHVAWDGTAVAFRRLPAPDEITYSAAPAYVHLTTNNTIYGTQWPREPEVPDGVPLVADASSDIYSRPIEVARYGLIYAGAQKNLGPSGIVLVLVRDDLLERAPATLPTMLQYRVHAKERSLYNTPNTWGIYVMGRVLAWIRDRGGLEGMARHNAAKAELLYAAIDASDFWRGTADPAARSLMNVCFRAPDEEREKQFVREATAAGLDGLKGHRSVGGMRASIYNACPREAVEALVQFMKEFERTRG
jgi:phosphoserine aminotransferase